ncbi:MAG: alkaline phosphatase family protein [Spirochaetaceae bacterium]|nr:alkaline phosphatase family protein [Spirochaetaceae bacterium]
MNLLKEATTTALNKYPFPDYNNSILSLSSSLLLSMGCPVDHPSLGILPPHYAAGFDHVVLLILDGLSYNYLHENRPNMDLPPEGQIHSISSVFPPTTAAALTTLYTGCSPMEHGYLGWTLFLKKLQCYASVLPGTLLGKRQEKSEPLPPIYQDLPLKGLFQRIQQQGDGRSCFYVFPQAYQTSQYTAMIGQGAHWIHYKKDKDFVGAVYSPVKKYPQEKTFTMAYHENPDKMLHLTGTQSPWAKYYPKHLGHQLCKMASRFRGSNTLLLVTADHGMTDMQGYLTLNETPELMDLLIRPPFPESRFLSFFVKPGKKELFKQRFMELLADDFLLIDRREFLRGNFLGPGKAHVLMEDFLGDYLAVATGHRGIKYYGSEKKLKRKSGQYKGHHAGITPEETNVPLMIFPFK